MSSGVGSNRQAAETIVNPRQGFTMAELLVTLAALALLVALLLPATRSARGAARRAQCQNNLKQVLLALHNYAEACGAFPPAFTVDANGRPLHSWRTLILPYLDEERLYRSIDLSKPWDDPANAQARETRVRAFQCAEADPREVTTRYLAVVAFGSCLRPGEPRRIADVSDDHSNTLILVEVDAEHAVPWMAPVDADEQLLLALRSSTTLGHAGVVLAGKVDGAAVALDARLPAKELRSLISIADGD